MDVIGGSKVGRLCSPSSVSLILPFLIPVQNADLFAFQLAPIALLNRTPFKVITGITFFNRADRAVKGLLLAVKILAVLVRNCDAQVTLPLFVFVGVGFELLCKKSAVLTLRNVKADNKARTATAFPRFLFCAENLYDIAASRERVAAANGCLCFISCVLFHLLFSSLSNLSGQ